MQCSNGNSAVHPPSRAIVLAAVVIGHPKAAIENHPIAHMRQLLVFCSNAARMLMHLNRERSSFSYVSFVDRAVAGMR